MAAGAWRPGPFTTHWIARPKRRLISAAPYHDRVIHHALMKVLEPILDRHLHADSYACRRGKGTHAAARRVRCVLARNRFFIQCDVVKFFPSIDHAILKDLFRTRIKDRRLLAVMDAVVDGSNEQEPVCDWFSGDDLFTPSDRRRGLLIGNLTSPWFANWYLDGLDHAATSRWGAGGYVRYCDDFVLLGNDPGRLRELADRCGEALSARRLRLHRERLPVRPRRAGLTFVGYRIWATHTRLPAANVRAFRRRLRWLKRAYAAGAVGAHVVSARLMSWLGHAGQAAEQRLVRRLARDWSFRRSADDAPRQQ
ncbi:MAG TPA: reverse transcriptase/maturase family protein [Gemmataceae bacterium]|nr:reverse transcriptase/maturase family protein [Gemmataceae bacterium]